MAAIVLLLTGLMVTATAQSVSFQVDESRAVLTADWLPKTNDLSHYVSKYRSVLERRQIKSLTLSFAYCQDPQYILDNFFNQTISVELLYINLDSCKITPQQLTTLFQAINAHAVRHLHLNLNSATHGQTSARMLGQYIAKFQLRSLKLGLMMLKMGDKGVNELFMHPLSQSLQQLSIDFTANKLGPNAFQNFSIFTSKLKPQVLRSVQLLIRSNRIQQNGTVYIAKALKDFTQLIILKLDVYFNHLKSKAVKPINLLIKRMTQLKILTLNFDFNYIQNQGGQLIGKAVAGLKDLQYLEIGVGTKNFGYNGYFQIVDGISALTKLRSLTLRCGVNRIGTKAALKLREAFRSNVNLQYVQLHLIQNLMGDEGLELIAQSLWELPHLITFRLNYGFNQVRGKGAVQLFRVMEQKKIKHMWVGLSNNAITQQTVNELLPILTSIFRSASSVELELLYTHVTVDASNKLKQVFEQCNGGSSCKCILHINTKEQAEQIRKQVDNANQL